MATSAPLSFSAFLQRADYSLLQSLTADPEQARHVPNKRMREVKSGHYVEVEPTPLPNPRYVIHSRSFFDELNLPDSLARDDAFMHFFTGNPALAVSSANTGAEPQRIRSSGWASGYALSIYGQEMYQNCPFNTGNGYGDGRAISVLEVSLPDNQRWEFQLKGGGTTPYCRGGDGRAILRSSIREFLVSEAMAALGVPTTRALCLYVSQSETISRPWYSPNAKTRDPDRTVDEPAAITTRAAPSFLRVGQLELFGRRARKNEHPNALAELEAIFLHVLEREYPDLAAQLSQTNASLTEKVLAVSREFAVRLSTLIAHWLRVGYCQGNFNSDNCALGGRTLDYGPFGFIEAYDPAFQMWTGGGEHFSFMNQPMAAMENFRMFCIALVPLLQQDESAIQALQEILDELPKIMQRELNSMWAAKMGLAEFHAELFTELHTLMAETPVDYTIFWRELSNLPKQVADLRVSFYETRGGYAKNSTAMEARWDVWLQNWHTALQQEARNPAELSAAMKRVNPKYIPREWMLVEAYRNATDSGDYSQVHQLHEVLEDPYSEQSEEVAALYYKKKDEQFFNLGGTSHCSCSS
ncbi:MAG: hypothetical protein B7Y56_15285 [Gallionellales bacterium 35-53-114]|jgi:uncharacterized protein YdiU (UPF0061 family)|nr:MAG: hypothetical protein B7Y56_15285 [Gallionellales bacterium 35-53-114]OYZ63121.1 MAG: hypothetical protein B7Y04_11700 [Gallionellales bacterium 24-53-125]OZB08899.1 MAG: hypothetical protein B7X61_07900 [Gallionellales bacterium 39-52-133]HQS59432.1 protein adenylyltransferase SelO family protein [Gallionellaceae bacterium]HQS76345.1 protein adenylyltransferase SelO family protein [Gallionellaceae bacterium]